MHGDRHLALDPHGSLFVRCREPRFGACHGTLVLVHGAGEHSGRYEHFFRRAIARRWRVIAADLRGHGQSSGVPTHLDRFDQYLDDLDLLWEQFELAQDTTAILGHSMGGLVSTRFAQTRPDRLSAIVLSSPLLAFGMRVPLLKQTLGRICLLVKPQVRFRTCVPVEQITRSEAVRIERAQDPLANRTVTAGWYFRVLDALYDAWCDAANLTAPLLLLQGEADQVVNAEAPLRWFPLVGSHDRTLRLLSGQLHELLNEPEWEQTADVILDWLDARRPSLCRPAATMMRAAA